MKYFLTAEERKNSGSSCFIEFQKGAYDGKCWKKDSICMDEEIFYDFKMKRLFSSVLPQFDYFGITPVSKEQFEKIKSNAKDYSEEVQASVAELEEYFSGDAEDTVFFTICGI